MKLICHSLFDHSSAEPFEKRSYLRGFYFNLRMNLMLMPDWRTHLEVDEATYNEYSVLFNWLKENANLNLQVNPNDTQLCRMMLWRLKPIFLQDVSHVLCRDTDSLTTYREALVTQAWLESGKKCCALNDNRAHSGMMGGMVGFDTAWIKACMEVNSWDQLVSGWDLSQRGSDQHLLNQKFLPRIKDDLYFAGSYTSGIKIPDAYSQEPLPQVDPKLWESNLCISFIGAAGFNEFETIRFFKRFDIENWKWAAIENQYPKLFHWRA